MDCKKYIHVDMDPKIYYSDGDIWHPIIDIKKDDMIFNTTIGTLFDLIKYIILKYDQSNNTIILPNNVKCDVIILI